MKSKGLSEQEVIESRKKYGSNALVEKKPVSFLKLFIESLGDPIIKILLIALAIKVIFLIKSFDWYETIGIVIAIFLASFISSISEYGSNKAVILIEEGTIGEGYLPKRQLKFVLAWAEIHKDELMQNWELSKDNKPLNRINPLI